MNDSPMLSTIEELPWDVYATTANLSQYTLPVNIEIKDFDLTTTTDSVIMSLNGADGCYHLCDANGPLVYAKLDMESAYLASIATIPESSGIVRYFYDEDGNMSVKASCSECLLEYLQYVDGKSGFYPLTEDLVYIYHSDGWHSDPNVRWCGC